MNEEENSVIVIENKTEKSKKGPIAAIIAALAAVFKGKGIMLLLLSKLKILFAVFKLSKFGGTAISMVVTIWIYASIYGLWYAAGFVLLLFIHELGHYYESKRLGLNVSGPVFIPFVGALINLKDELKDAVVDAKVGYSGPLAGSIGAFAMLGVYWLTASKLALVLAFTGFILNLFNLIPVHPLDGGRVVTAVSPYLWFIGLPLLIFFFFKTFNIIIVLIIISGIKEAYNLWKGRNKEYFSIDSKTRGVFAVLYFGLVGALGAGIWFTSNILK